MTMEIPENVSEADFVKWQQDREILLQTIEGLTEERDFLHACCKNIIADCEKATAELTKKNEKMRYALERIGRMDAQAIALIALGQLDD